MQFIKTIQAITTGSLLCACVLTIGGCAIAKAPYDPRPKPAPFQTEAPVLKPSTQVAMAGDGSLWKPGFSLNMVSDDKAWRAGDILQVRVVQKNSGTKKANTDTSRKSSITAKIKYLLGLEEDINELTEYTQNNPKGSGSWDPNNLIEAQSEKTFKGSGSTERTDDLTATVSVIVTEVLTNGDLVIYGHQTVQLNNEASVLTVQGIVRPSDIGDDNVLSSTRIANANIEFTGSGVLTDKQHPGWGMRIFDWVWPL